MRHRVHASLAVTLCLAGCLAAAAARGSQDVEATPQAKAYRAALQAIAAGDYDAYRKTLSSATRKQMDEQTKGKSRADVMDFVKSVSPSDQKLTGLDVDGEKAVLSVSGTMDGQAMTGSIAMTQEGGQWKVGQPTWAPAK